MGKRKVSKIEKRPFELLGSNGRFILGFFRCKGCVVRHRRVQHRLSVLNPAVENLAEVVQLGRGNALPLADAVNGAAADVVVVDQCISAFPAPLHRFPEFVVYNHFITQIKDKI